VTGRGTAVPDAGVGSVGASDELGARRHAVTSRGCWADRAQGRDNARIADALCIAAGTVKNHVASIYAKLNVGSRAEAVAWAWQHGLMDE